MLESVLLQPLSLPWDVICFMILAMIDDTVGPSDILVCLSD